METTQRPEKGAVIDGPYRYLLWRTWSKAHPGEIQRHLLWVLLNPSKADAHRDDQTLTRCIGFSKAWGYDGLEIVNLFAFIATNPRDLQGATDPVGPENDCYLAAAAARAADIIVAWGEHGTAQQRDRAVLALLKRQSARPLWCLGTVRNGCPHHPVRLANSALRVPYLSTGR
ncbi:MAG TPA: DUF1643 domain-containing protein [Ktedonobacterales bacterium]|nr:DUF1643 domain-containing protein [Ktedonobacterales bacterium]